MFELLVKDDATRHKGVGRIHPRGPLLTVPSELRKHVGGMGTAKAKEIEPSSRRIYRYDEDAESVSMDWTCVHEKQFETGLDGLRNAARIVNSSEHTS